MIFLIGNVNFLALTGISHISFQKLRSVAVGLPRYVKQELLAASQLATSPKNELLVHLSAWVANLDKRFIFADGWQYETSFRRLILA